MALFQHRKILSYEIGEYARDKGDSAAMPGIVIGTHDVESKAADIAE